MAASAAPHAWHTTAAPEATTSIGPTGAYAHVPSALEPGDMVTVVLDDDSHAPWEVLVADGPPSRRYYVLGPT
jgi:hypothetical protein